MVVGASLHRFSLLFWVQSMATHLTNTVVEVEFFDSNMVVGASLYCPFCWVRFPGDTPYQYSARRTEVRKIEPILLLSLELVILISPDRQLTHPKAKGGPLGAKLGGER
jgi:hypothetical protein